MQYMSSILTNFACKKMKINLYFLGNAKPKCTMPNIDKVTTRGGVSFNVCIAKGVLEHPGVKVFRTCLNMHRLSKYSYVFEHAPSYVPAIQESQ